MASLHLIFKASILTWYSHHGFWLIIFIRCKFMKISRISNTSKTLLKVHPKKWLPFIRLSAEAIWSTSLCSWEWDVTGSRDGSDFAFSRLRLSPSDESSSLPSLPPQLAPTSHSFLFWCCRCPLLFDFAAEMMIASSTFTMSSLISGNSFFS